MIKDVSLINFTVFGETTFRFGKHLNVFVGENGLGKTHILKAIYATAAVCAKGQKDSGSDSPTKTYLQKAIASKLRGVFRPDEIGRLARRQVGRNRCEVHCTFDNSSLNLSYTLNNRSVSEVTILVAPAKWLADTPVFLPTRELLTIYPGFVSLYETTHLPFEETWRDTAIYLGAPLARGQREGRVKNLLEPIESALGGKVEVDEHDRFYLKTSLGRIEMHLVAEGLRKLAMLARLIANGSLLDKGFLFWDEPEANLNPKLVKVLARTILELGKSGIQVFIATHSLFLLRELYILQLTPDFSDISARYFGLRLDKSDAIAISQGNNMDEIGEISALDEALQQSERYLNADAATIREE